jgi:hypothetical protein
MIILQKQPKINSITAQFYAQNFGNAILYECEDKPPQLNNTKLPPQESARSARPPIAVFRAFLSKKLSRRC